MAGDDIATATLNDTPEARAFAATLPIAVDMQDPFGQAKTGAGGHARFPSMTRSDLGAMPPAISHIGHPVAKLAVVYDALGRSVPPPRLVRLGTVHTGLEAIASAGNDFTNDVRRSP